MAIDYVRISSSVEEALKYKKYAQTMGEKMKALEKNSTWEII